MRWRSAVGIVLAVLLAALVALGEESPRRHVVDFAAFTALLDAGEPLLLIDTRTEDSYHDGHIPTAIGIPGYLFNRDGAIPALPDDRNTILIAYCGGGHCGVADFVGERLLDRGYRRVFVFEEGVEGWRAHGQLLVTKRHEELPSISKQDLAALVAAGSPMSLLDARAPAEFQGRTVPGAVNLPVENCRPGTEHMPPSVDMLVVVYGQSRWDGRPYHVADRLLAWGYKKVRLFSGGVNEWSKP